LLITSNNLDAVGYSVFMRVGGRGLLTENPTPHHKMRVRIVGLPKFGEIDELSLRQRFRVGEIYELPVQLAATLIIAGYAEGVVDRASVDRMRAVAADTPPRRRRRSDDSIV
jgi:hypothetical protein